MEPSGDGQASADREPVPDGQPVDELGGADPFVVTTRADGARTVVTLTGELDLDATHRLLLEVRQALTRTGPEAVDLELHGLSFVDSSGLQALLAARDEIVDAGVRFRVASISALAARVVEIAGLGHVLSPADGGQG
jgi:stage II sporulation protein AA (anti-sigma F factor antagonist)